MILEVNIAHVFRQKVLLWGTFLFLMVSCSNPNHHWNKLEGQAQGTTFNITYYDTLARDFSKDIDLILTQVDDKFSTYNDSSMISLWNHNQIKIIDNQEFMDLWNLSMTISHRSGGYFDPLIKPLVNYWGFGEKAFQQSGDSLAIDSILKFKNDIIFDDHHIQKKDPRCKIDLNAIAQGYTVDLVCDFLDQLGIQHYMVEIGGELRCKGKNKKQDLWTAGIDKPTDTLSTRTFQTVVKLQNKALATSGNYRKYYMKDGKKYAHVIDPFTGYPASHNLLSVSVMANTCAEADAYATAFLCMGKEKTLHFLQENISISSFPLMVEVFLIYEENGQLKTYQSLGFPASELKP